jgi:hypothetical protein
MKLSKKIALVGIVMIGTAAIAFGLQAQMRGTTQIAKPDLTVEKIEFTTAPAAGGATQLTILYTIYNDSNVPSRNAPTEAGKNAWKANPVSNLMFETKLDVRDYPSGAWQNVSTIQLELWGHVRTTCNAGLLIPAGKKKEFRATVDSLNWINESNETNNDKKAIWPPTVTPASIQR